MMKQKVLSRFVSLLALIGFASACIPSPSPIPSAPTETAAEPVTAVTAAPSVVIQPTETPMPTKSPVVPAVKGFVLFDKEKGEFHGYAPDGSRLFTSPAPGSDYPSGFTTSIVDGSIYYMLARNRAEGREPQLLQSSPAGVEKVETIPTDYTSALAISPDETWAAWSTLGPENGVSEMWITNIQTSDQRKIATYSYQQGEAFFLRPFAWTDDGKLLFERAITGIGGYILFGGHNSLYTYDPTSGAIETIVPAEEMHMLCLDSYHPAMDKVIFNCRQGKPEIIIRDLKDQSEMTIPALAGQGAAGSAHYSPSGKWLAYAVAANEPENESGKLVIVPSDLSTAPQVLAEVKDNRYIVVQGWLDEDTLIFNRVQWPEITTWSVHLDGSGLTQIASGFWIGWIP